MAHKHIDDAYHKGGRVRSGFDFAQILGDVMRSDAFRNCPDYATRVLFALAAKFRKRNNGDLSLTAAEGEEYGITSEWKLRAGLTILERTGLVELMRQGRISNGQGVCSLYALGWREINASDKYDIPSIVTVRAPNRWAKWKRPDDWEAQLDEIRRKAQGKTGKNRPTWPHTKNAHPTREDCTATHVGSGKRISRPTRGEQETQFTAPHVGGTSKRSGSSTGAQGLGSLTESLPSASGPSANKSGASKAKRLRNASKALGKPEAIHVQARERRA